ncbi:MAG: AAA family ATPase [Clostridiales bacterium]|jgi:uncharacterized protein YhaN|nr:AAA family ATPase [Clostridiales bacterium]
MGLRWASLTLSGFGRYKDRVTIKFHPEVSVCLAENEQGKSTLVAGLAAVIFGLQNIADPRKFGSARYRNWHNPSSFEGELEFFSGDIHYRILRNFDDNRISLQRKVDGQWQEEVSGEHNPGAHKPNLTYEQKISELIGFNDRELFTATFQVTQPLPEGDKIIPGIQQLLSGSGAHYQTALTALIEELKSITRYTGRMGITPRDMNNERRLELLEKEISIQDTQITASRQTVVELQDTAASLQEAREQFQCQTALLTEKSRLMEAWKQWRTLQERYKDAAVKQATVTAAYQHGKILADSVSEKEKRLSQEFAQFSKFPPETGDQIVTVSHLSRELAVQQQKLVQLTERMKEESAEIVRLDELLGGELSTVKGRHDLPALCRGLRTRLSEWREIEGSISKLQGQCESLKNRIAALPDFAKLGKAPLHALDTLRRQCELRKEDWNEYRSDMENLRQIQEQIFQQYRPFEEADDSLLELLAAYETGKMRLDVELGASQNARGLALQKIEQIQAARKHYQRLFAEMERLDDTGLSLVEKKLDLLQAKKAEEDVLRQTASASHSSGLGQRLAVFIMMLAGVGAAYYYTGNPVVTGVIAVAAGFVTFIILKTIAGKKEKAQPQARLGEINAQMRQVDTLLGSFSVSSEAQLGELRIRLRQRQEEQDRIQQMQADLPDDDELSELKTRLEQAKKESDAFMERTAVFTAKYSDIPAAFRQWRELSRDANTLRKKTADFLRRQTNIDNGQLVNDIDLQSLSSPWTEVGVFSTVCGVGASTLGEALDWLEALDDSWWSKVRGDVIVYEEVTEEYAAAKNGLSALTEEGSEGAQRRERLAGEIEELRAALAPFDENTEPERLENMLSQWSAAEAELTRRRSAMTTLLQQQEEITLLTSDLQEKLAPLLEMLAPLIGDECDLTTVVERWHSFREIRRLHDEEKKELAGVLSSHGVTNMAEMQQNMTDTTNKAISALQQWETLISDFPALPGTQQDDPAALHTSFLQLEDQIIQLRADVESLQEKLRELDVKYARLQGQTPVNIAAGEVRLSELRTQRDRLNREALSLELAYNELAAAIEEFSQSYRQEFAAKTTEYFSRLTGVNERRVLVDDQFSVSIMENGKPASVSQLSQGARDQLYIALRLAIADLLTGETSLPFIFDDPFLNWDDERLERMRQAVMEVKNNRQVLLFSHRQEFSAWGNRCWVEI